MTITTHTTSAIGIAASTSATRAFWWPAAVAAVAAATATTSVAAVAHSAGVSLTMDREPLPLAAFAQLTLTFSALGILLAAGLRRWTSRPRRAFIRTTIVLIALSLVPDLLVSASPATKVTLMATHLVAATIVIPVVSARLARGRDGEDRP